ncbi:hypothetical protein B0H67DRAFT_608978 [Lasiosphaeris hirsuta]|uniref:Uncharacterized protein n=1 Tax=Lasiosphaeris hirsuta TaxID=260670 RepID=A0AA40DXQ6_9PEZI|nr:hypothetical protein B0H67DRAFT_608978 [Lasiosphaeris hirsuta]
MEGGHDSLPMPHVPVLHGTFQHCGSLVDAEVETSSWGSFDDPFVAGSDTLLQQGGANGNLSSGGPRAALPHPLVQPQAPRNSRDSAEALYSAPDDFTSQSSSPNLSSSDSLTPPSPPSVSPGGQDTRSTRLVFEFSLSEHYGPPHLDEEYENAVFGFSSSDTVTRSTPQQAYSIGSALSLEPQGGFDFPSRHQRPFLRLGRPWVKFIKDSNDKLVEADLSDDSDDESVTPVDKSSGGVVEEPNQKPTKYVIFSPPTSGAEKRARAPQPQRAHCEPNEKDNGNPLAPCKTCLNVDKKSKKTIHYIPCLRYKLTGITMHRTGSLNITGRFRHNQLVDLPTYGDHRVMLMTQDLCGTPMTVQVRRFRPMKQDDIIRRYIDVEGNSQEFYTAPYCISNLGNAARDLWRYIGRNAVDGLLVVGDRSGDPVVKRTFAMLAKQCRTTLVSLLALCSLSDGAETRKDASTTKSGTAAECKEFLNDAVRLWFTTKLGTGTARLCGSDLLGMLPPDDLGYPYVGIPAPRMVVAQMDSLRYHFISSSFTTTLLRRFESLITSNNMACWFTVYLTTFLLLYEVSAASHDRLRYALHNGMPQETQYGSFGNPLTGFVEDMQFGGVMLLAYWHYFKRVDFFNLDWGDLSKSPLRSLELHQIELLKWTVAQFDPSLGKVPRGSKMGTWDNELYWISHMFDLPPSKESGWAPPKAFEREKAMHQDKPGPSSPASNMPASSISEPGRPPSSWLGSGGSRSRSSTPDSACSTPPAK